MNVHAIDDGVKEKLAYVLRAAKDSSVLPDDLDRIKKCIAFIESHMHLLDSESRHSACTVYFILLRRAIAGEQTRELLEGLDSGTHCPTCNRFIKRYKRKLNSGMARTLIWLYHHQRATGQRWVHVADVAPTHVLRSNEISRLVLWNLVKEKVSPNELDKRTSGLYRITNDGEDFVEGKMEVPSHVALVNNKVEGFADTTTNIRAALGSKFSYNELMGYEI